MARSNMLFFKCFYFVLLAFTYSLNSLCAQGNCLIYADDSGERLACELSYRAISYKQGSKESQLLFDAAIKLGPKYAYAYYQKAVPFFKRGLLSEGVNLLNKAIELEPQNYLYYRAYWYFYNRSYDFCIQDLEDLYVTHKAFYNSTPGGELEMRLLLALSYAQLGNPSKGIYWILDLMDTYEDQPHLLGLYDHFCLGLLYFHNQQFDLAQSQFEKQLAIDDGFADTYYYLGLIKEEQVLPTLAKGFFNQALERMNGKHGGYSSNLFTEFNTAIEDVENKL